jgi:uncharacterized membrane protein
MPSLERPGRVCFAVAVAASGLMQVINGEFVRLVPVPGPAGPLWAVASGVLLLLLGGCLLTGYRAKAAGRLLAALLALSFAAQRVPEIWANPGAGYVWTNPAKVLALAGGAWLAAGAGPRGRCAAAWLLGAFLVLCGVQHYAYADFVDTLVPAWIPPGPRFWTCFTGAALVAGGLGLVWPRARGPAAFLSGAMILAWVFLLHLPRSFTLHSAFELAGVWEALAVAGVAWQLTVPGQVAPGK